MENWAICFVFYVTEATDACALMNVLKETTRSVSEPVIS